MTLDGLWRGPYPTDSKRHHDITAEIGKFIAKDLQPYSVVENIGFINLLKAMDNRYHIPSRKHFTKKVALLTYSPFPACLKE